MASSPINSNDTISDNTISNDTFEMVGYYEKIFIQILASTGSVQNLMFLLAIITSAKIRRKITFIYVINLLFAQLLLSTITVPMFCFAPNFFLYPYVTALTIIAYTLNLCSVTYERFMAICRPYRYSESISYSKAVKVSIMCWLIAAFIQILPVFWKNHPDSIIIQRIYLGATLAIFFIAPLCIIWIAYVYITYEIYGLGKANDTVITKSQPSNESIHLDNNNNKLNRKKNIFNIFNRVNISRPRQEFQLAAVFIAAAVASSITWVPVILMVFLQVIDRTDLEPESLSKIHIYLLVMNANLDPLLYGMFLKPLRLRLFGIFFGTVKKFPKNNGKV